MTIAALRAIQDEARLTTVQLLENVEYLLSSGCTPAGIAARLDMEMEAIEKRCYRAGRLKLAAPFNNAVKHRRLEASVVEQAHQGPVNLWEQVTIQVAGDRSAGVPQTPGNRQGWLAAG